ncbi:MAG: molecular chaperone DnaJ [Bacteroidales bacterium]
MAEKRDYYEVLGVSKSASADEIKNAYRQLAIKWHPDKWVNGTDAEKKTAEDKFKEASEAYSILSDPDKKAKYDQFGFSGVNGQGAPDFSGGFGNLDDILNDLFGGNFGGFSGFGGFGGFGSQRGSSSQQSAAVRGRDIRTRVSLTLEEIATGVEKSVTILRSVPCPDCSGKGAKSSSDIKRCTSCNGTGQVQHVTSSFFGRSISYTICPQCNGTGKIITHPCSSCSGTGLVRKRETVKVKIPAGVEHDMQLTVRGAGHAGLHNGPCGDLLVVIEETEHPTLKRDGNNLFYSQIISVTDAMLGTNLSIPCLDGSYKIKLEPGTQSGTIVKLKGKGLPSLRGSGKGDLYVKIMVWIPRKLSGSEKTLFESIRTNPSFTPDLNRDDKNLFDKEKNIF